MRDSRRTSIIVSVALICLLSTPFAFAAAGSVAGCTSMAVNRISGAVDETVRTPLSGNIHPLARAEFDQGKVSDSLPLEHMIMLAGWATLAFNFLAVILKAAAPTFAVFEGGKRWCTPRELLGLLYKPLASSALR